MRVGIDMDGVLRDLTGHIQSKVLEEHPEFEGQMLPVESWDWSDWMPFWTDEQAEEFIFETHHEYLFGPECPPIETSITDWPILKEWAKENGHELILVSAQRENCVGPATAWLEKYGFDFDEIHFTNKKHLVDVDVLIDDSPEKLGRFQKQSVNNGTAICYRQSWNKKSQQSKLTIVRLSDIMTMVFGE